MSKALLLLPLAAACAESTLPALTTAVDELSRPTCVATPLAGFNTDGDEGRLVLSPDGRTAMWHREGANGLELAESHLVGGAWTAPVKPSFASAYLEFDPFIALDGRTIYYTSFRPLTGTAQRPDGELWRVRRTATGWSAPEHLGPGINTDANEFFPSLTADGTLWWNSDREGGLGTWDLWQAREHGAGWSAPRPVPGGVNTPIWEFNPTLTPGGTLLAFGSLDPDPQTPSDVFLSLRIGGAYSAAIDAGPCVNTILEEYHPTLDWARARLIFVRRNVETSGDFYEVRLPALFSAMP